MWLCQWICSKKCITNNDVSRRKPTTRFPFLLQAIPQDGVWVVGAYNRPCYLIVELWSYRRFQHVLRQILRFTKDLSISRYHSKGERTPLSGHSLLTLTIISSEIACVKAISCISILVLTIPSGLDNWMDWSLSRTLSMSSDITDASSLYCRRFSIRLIIFGKAVSVDLPFWKASWLWQSISFSSIFIRKLDNISIGPNGNCQQ